MITGEDIIFLAFRFFDQLSKLVLVPGGQKIDIKIEENIHDKVNVIHILCSNCYGHQDE